MEAQLKGIEWEAYEHQHTEKNSDWFWILGILTLAGTITSVVLHNMLLGILILIGGTVMAILSTRPPKVVSYTLTLRGIRIDEKLYPFSTLESYHIDDTHYLGPQLLIRSEKLFMPLLIIPIPEEHADDIEDIVADRLPEEHLEEPLANKLLEFFGF